MVGAIQKEKKSPRATPTFGFHKNIDEATLSLFNSQKNWRSYNLFSVKPFLKGYEAIVLLLNSQKFGDHAIIFL